jgi:thiamine-monophosphate kinase
MPALTEFALIARYFTRPCAERQGVGDDCALIDAGGQTLALTSDMLLEGVHFLPGADPRKLGHKALAVNLSDLAAAGARPRAFLLDLALPRADAHWLAGFSAGLFELAQAQGCALIGGDTTRTPAARQQDGPIVIAITALGEVPAGRWRGRGGARPGDDIWVSGRLGEAALGLALRRLERGEPGLLPADFDARAGGAAAQADWQQCRERMDRPEPRVALGLALGGLASAAIDVSDGLVGDLGHILERSAVGARLSWLAVPCAPLFDRLPQALRAQCVLAGGDDYELVFTAPAPLRAQVAALATPELPLTRIGAIAAQPGLHFDDGEATLAGTTLQSFDHFRAPADGA